MHVLAASVRGRYKRRSKHLGTLVFTKRGFLYNHSFGQAAEPGENRARSWRFSGAACFLLEGQFPCPQSRAGPPSRVPRVVRSLRLCTSGADVIERLSFGVSFWFRFAFFSLSERASVFSYSRCVSTFEVGPFVPDLFGLPETFAHLRNETMSVYTGRGCFLVICCLSFDSDTFLFCHQGFYIFTRLNLSVSDFLSRFEGSASPKLTQTKS